MSSVSAATTIAKRPSARATPPAELAAQRAALAKRFNMQRTGEGEWVSTAPVPARRVAPAPTPAPAPAPEPSSAPAPAVASLPDAVPPPAAPERVVWFD